MKDADDAGVTKFKEVIGAWDTQVATLLKTPLAALKNFYGMSIKTTELNIPSAGGLGDGLALVLDDDARKALVAVYPKIVELLTAEIKKVDPTEAKNFTTLTSLDGKLARSTVKESIEFCDVADATSFTSAKTVIGELAKKIAQLITDKKITFANFDAFHQMDLGATANKIVIKNVGEWQFTDIAEAKPITDTITTQFETLCKTWNNINKNVTFEDKKITIDGKEITAVKALREALQGKFVAEAVKGITVTNFADWSSLGKLNIRKKDEKIITFGATPITWTFIDKADADDIATAFSTLLVNNLCANTVLDWTLAKNTWGFDDTAEKITYKTQEMFAEKTIYDAVRDAWVTTVKTLIPTNLTSFDSVDGLNLDELIITNKTDLSWTADKTKIAELTAAIDKQMIDAILATTRDTPTSDGSKITTTDGKTIIFAKNYSKNLGDAITNFAITKLETEILTMYKADNINSLFSEFKEGKPKGNATKAVDLSKNADALKKLFTLNLNNTITKEIEAKTVPAKAKIDFYTKFTISNDGKTIACGGNDFAVDDNTLAELIKKNQNAAAIALLEEKLKTCFEFNNIFDKKGAYKYVDANFTDQYKINDAEDLDFKKCFETDTKEDYYACPVTIAADKTIVFRGKKADLVATTNETFPGKLLSDKTTAILTSYNALYAWDNAIRKLDTTGFAPKYDNDANKSLKIAAFKIGDLDFKDADFATEFKKAFIPAAADAPNLIAYTSKGKAIAKKEDYFAISKDMLDYITAVFNAQRDILWGTAVYTLFGPKAGARGSDLRYTEVKYKDKTGAAVDAVNEALKALADDDGKGGAIKAVTDQLEKNANTDPTELKALQALLKDDNVKNIFSIPTLIGKVHEKWNALVTGATKLSYNNDKDLIKNEWDKYKVLTKPAEKISYKFPDAKDKANDNPLIAFAQKAKAILKTEFKFKTADEEDYDFSITPNNTKETNTLNSFIAKIKAAKTVK